jgi:hypothetical protein
VVLQAEGAVAFATALATPGEWDPFLRFITDREPRYLSPEQLRLLQTMNYHPKKQRHDLSDCFSLGMLMLEIVTLRSSLDLYLWEDLSIDFPAAEARLSCVPYSPFLKRMLGAMLVEDLTRRPSYGEILSVLEPYRGSILTLQPFVPERALSQHALEQYAIGDRENSLKPVVHDRRGHSLRASRADLAKENYFTG